MTVTIELSPHVERKIQERATEDGIDVPTYIQLLLESVFFSETEASGTSESDRRRWIAQTFEEIDRKYGEALRNLARR
jgi:hypothetical protein